MRVGPAASGETDFPLHFSLLVDSFRNNPSCNQSSILEGCVKGDAYLMAHMQYADMRALL